MMKPSSAFKGSSECVHTFFEKFQGISSVLSSLKNGWKADAKIFSCCSYHKNPFRNFWPVVRLRNHLYWLPSHNFPNSPHLAIDSRSHSRRKRISAVKHNVNRTVSLATSLHLILVTEREHQTTPFKQKLVDGRRLSSTGMNHHSTLYSAQVRVFVASDRSDY